MVYTNKNNNLDKNSINLLINLFQNSKYKEAELLAINICKKSPNETISWKILGIIYLISGRYNKALFANKRALKLGSKTPDVFNNLAISYYNLGRYQESIKNSKEALKININFFQAYGSLGDSFKAIKKYEDASFYLKKAILLNPKKVETYVSLADVLVKLDKSDEALATYEKAIKLNSNYFPAYINMGETLNNLGVDEYESQNSQYQEMCRKSCNINSDLFMGPAMTDTSKALDSNRIKDNMRERTTSTIDLRSPH